jgi:hypothetical protein
MRGEWLTSFLSLKRVSGLPQRKGKGDAMLQWKDGGFRGGQSVCENSICSLMLTMSANKDGVKKGWVLFINDHHLDTQTMDLPTAKAYALGAYRQLLRDQLRKHTPTTHTYNKDTAKAWLPHHERGLKEIPVKMVPVAKPKKYRPETPPRGTIEGPEEFPGQDYP